MENLKSNTKSINISIILILLIVIFIIYMLKDYFQGSTDSIELSNKLFTKYKGNKDNMFDYDDINIEFKEQKEENIMKEECFIKKRKKTADKMIKKICKILDNDKSFLKKKRKNNIDTINLKKKIIKNDDNIIKCQQKKYIKKEVESFDLDEKIIENLNKKNISYSIHLENVKESKQVLENNQNEKETNVQKNIEGKIENNQNNNEIQQGIIQNKDEEIFVNNKLFALQESADELRKMANN